MCTSCATYRPQRLHRGHLRFLRLTAAMRRKQKALSKEGLRAEWESVEAVKAAAEEPVVGMMQAIFEAQSEAVISRLPSVVGPMLGARVKRDDDPLLVEQILDLVFWDAVIERELGPLLRKVLETGFRTGVLRVDVEVPAFSPTPRTNDVLQDVLRKTKGTTFTTQKQLAGIVRDGLRNNSSLDEIADAIRRQFQDWQQWRAPLVAQTASTSTFETGQVEGFLEAGVEFMMWLSQRDGQVRPSHWDVDEEEVKVGEPFSNGLMFPGDPMGPPEEVIGCRCTTLPIVPEGGPSKTLITPAGKLIRMSEMNDRELQRVELAIRDYHIRTAYPQLKDDKGSEEALRLLARKHFVSESTARAAVYGR